MAQEPSINLLRPWREFVPWPKVGVDSRAADLSSELQERAGVLFRLDAFNVPSQITYSELLLLRVRHVHLSKDWAPYRHFCGAVRRYFCAELQHRNDPCAREFPAVVPGKLSQICRLHLMGGRSRPITFAVHAMTRCTIAHKHLFAAGRVGLCDRHDDRITGLICNSLA